MFEVSSLNDNTVQGFVPYYQIDNHNMRRSDALAQILKIITSFRVWMSRVKVIFPAGRVSTAASLRVLCSLSNDLTGYFVMR